MAAMCPAASCFWGCAPSSAVIRCSPLNGKPKENFSLSWTLPCQVFSCCDKQSNHCPFLFLLHTSFRLLCPTHSHTYTHTHSLTHPLTHIQTLTIHSHTYILSQTHTHINTRTLTHTYAHSHAYGLSNTLTHSHTLTVWLERSRIELRKDREDRKRKGWGKKFPRGTKIKG